ncbi:60S ribosomal protein L9 [Datura stramonium]|uniref:60S ribosomal protein L9 n=1 Tax=Datura stramonium TaxID=4076 RepID=A0ABS8RMI5_DATST|nr:60S ribosomal protein L9 [Datura stramonium]
MKTILSSETMDNPDGINIKANTSIRTALGHVENLITGFAKGYWYKMLLVYAHFSINASITGGNKSIEICNFLGEKRVRKVDIVDGVTVVRCPLGEC